MQKSLDEWYKDFQAIVFRGFFATGNAADKFREMEHENTKLKALLRGFMTDIQEDAKVKNGKENGVKF